MLSLSRITLGAAANFPQKWRSRVARSLSTIPSRLVRRCRFALCLAALCAAIPLAAPGAEVQQQPAAHPQQPTQHPRPSAEERRKYEERMRAIHPAKPGCFEAHYPDEHWVETKCLPPPRTPNPHGSSPRPNTVGAGTDWFATVTSGNISQATGSFDLASGIIALESPKGGDTSTFHPNTYTLQMNTNLFTPAICGGLTNCAWVQFIFSQSQCGSSPCIFIEYWLLNHASPCPSNASWNFYPGGSGTTPGCYLNTPATNLPAVPLADFGSLRLNATVQNGVDIVTVSDASGTLGSASNASIANLGSGWTGVEYIPAGDCCGTEAFFFTGTTSALNVRVAVVNGTTNAPNCATNSTFNGTTAETNNLNLGGCAAVGGATPAIVFAENGNWLGPASPVSINDTLSFIKTANTPNGHVEVHLASGTSGYLTRILETATTFANESDGVWQLLPNRDLAFIKTSNTPSGHVEVHIASRASNYQSRILETATTFANETDGVWQLLPNQDLAFIKTSNTPSGHVEVHIASRASDYKSRILETPTTFVNESDGVWQLLPNQDLAFIKTSNTPSGHVEVHIASRASDYKSRILETPTTFVNESDGVWQLLPNQDLAFIKTSNTPSVHVEVHIASRASDYKSRILETPTTFANESDGVWSLVVP